MDNQTQQPFKSLHLLWIIPGTFLVYILGLFIPLMDIDASQYASIAREMLDTGNYLTITYRGQDYLDKPPLLFWLATLSYRVFGIHAWAYKLPSVLLSLLTYFATYRLATIYYSKATAFLAALLLATTQAYFLILQDVRTDTILITGIALTLWQLAAYLHHRRTIHLIGISLGIALGMLTKGPLGLMVPALGFGTYLFLTRQYRLIFHAPWLLVALLVMLMLTPMCIGLYQQYGLYGLYFYFWEQSFGRITGSNSWANNPDPFFLLHSFLWSFLPWTLLFLTAYGTMAHRLYQSRRQLSSVPAGDLICIAAITLSYLILSRSRYQLPHYIYGILPFAAIITAHHIMHLTSQLSSRLSTYLLYTQRLILVALHLVLWVIITVLFPANPLIWALAAAITTASLYLLWHTRHSTTTHLILPGLSTAIGINLILNLHAYPDLLQYQPAPVIAHDLLEHERHTGHIATQFDLYTSNALDFYARKTIPKYTARDIIHLPLHQTIICHTGLQGIKKLTRLGCQVQILNRYYWYPVSRLTPHFLLPTTRPFTLQRRYHTLVTLRQAPPKPTFRGLYRHPNILFNIYTYFPVPK